jgi:hypothetical protein
MAKDIQTDLDSMAHDFLTDEELAEILAEESALGIEISLEEIMADMYDDDFELPEYERFENAVDSEQESEYSELG